MTREKAIKWMQAEKVSLERAPDLNGCPMTAVWQEAIDVYDMAISALRAQQDVPDTDVGKNEPLTLEELRKMDGEPVYIIRFEDKRGWWAVIHGVTKSKLTTDYGGWFALEDYGKSWLAYRQKPEDGTV